MKFAVYGSCVARDVFNFLDNREYEVDITIGGNPVMCMYDKGKLNIDKEDIVINSKFVNRMIAHTLHKSARENLFASDAQYLCFDLATERLPLQTWTFGKEKSVVPVTWNIYQLSQKLRQNEKYRNLKIDNWRLADQDRELWKRALGCLCEDIRRKWNGRAIYLQIRQSDQFIDRNRDQIRSLTGDRELIDEGIDDRGLRDRQNRMIEEAEKILFEMLPDLYVIPMPEGCLCSTRHHFGIHPLHFDYLYYEYAAKAVQLIVDHPNTTDSKKVIDHNVSFLKRSYDDKFLTIGALCRDVNRKSEIFFWGGVESYHVFRQVPDIKITDKVIGKSISDVLERKLKVTMKSEVLKGIRQEEGRKFIGDVGRTGVDMIRYSKADVLLIDLLSEVESTVCFGEEQYMAMDAYSKELVRNVDTIYGNIRTRSYDTYDFHKVETGLLKLCQEIGRKRMKVILNERYYKEFYFDGKRMRKFDGITDKNVYLKKCYDILKENMDDIRCIKMPQYSFSYTGNSAVNISNEEYLYYQRMFRRLMDEDETESLYREQSLKNRQFVKHKRFMLRNL